MSEWREVADLATLQRERRVVARLGGREIGVVLTHGGAVYALRNRCPHHGAPLCLGELLPRTMGGPGTYSTSGETVLRCPWHGWEFDPATGACLVDGALRAAVYETRVEDGRVLVRA